MQTIFLFLVSGKYVSHGKCAGAVDLQPHEGQFQKSVNLESELMTSELTTETDPGKLRNRAPV